MKRKYMKQLIHLKVTIAPPVRGSIRCPPIRRVLLLVPLLIGCFVLSPGVQALPIGTSALEGVVKDPTGRPIKGADVRIEAKNFSKIAKTDASGHYISSGLVVGAYKVTVVVNGSVKASIPNAKTQSGKPTQLNFDLTTTTALAKKHIHSVWCPNETGTLIGGTGRWIDVDDNGNIVNNTGVISNTGVKSTTGFNNVEKVSLQWEAAPRYKGSTPQKPAKLGGQ
jgi:hypothetical protein